MASKSNFEEPDAEWMDNANCKGMGCEYFFPIELKSKIAASKILAVKAICEQCTVNQECLSYALDTNQKYGIWGGLTEPERSNLSQASKGKRLA
ncbi:MAG: WhiB family transcriptional regulator, redox-sensing transcriptional regulator [Patescibacteria group bacterium]|nr:WhiB family transcriptional regulator, redox-sensing transcriptional regulator [Patescibacteria group bacterium]